MISLFKKYNFITLVTAVFFLILPFFASYDIFYGAVNAKFFLALFFSYIVFFFFGLQIINKKIVLSVRQRWLLLILSLLIVTQYISSFLSLNPTISFFSDIFRSSGTLFLTHLAVLIFIFSEIFKKRDWIFLRRVIVGSSAVFSFLYSLGSWGFGFFDTKIGFLNFEANGFQIGNETFAGIFVVISVVLTLIEFVNLQKENSKHLKIFLYTALALQFLSPLMIGFPLYTSEVTGLNSVIGGARSSALVAWGILFYFLLIHKLFRFNKKIVVFTNAILLILVCVLTVSLFTRGSIVQREYIKLSGEARILVWESAFESIKERPIVGYGPGTFNDVMHRNINPDLFLEKNGGEIWFDRAHNIVIQTLTSQGILGLLVGLVFVGYIFLVLRNSTKKGLISTQEQNLLDLLVVGHLVQILTGFDTIISYVLWSFVLGYIVWLEKNTIDYTPDKNRKNIIAGYILIVLTIVSFFGLYSHELSKQKKLFSIFVSSSFDMRIELIEKFSNQRITLEPVRLLSQGVVKGVFDSGKAKDPRVAANTRAELDYYDQMLVTYIEKNPYDYRARMNLIYIRHAQAFLGVDKLDQTTVLFENIHEFSPENNPLTKVMMSLHSLYTADIDKSQSLINDVVISHPDLKFAKGVKDYIDTQIASLPKVVFLKLENL